MYFPKSQIKENLYTDGTEYMVAATKKPYKGYYFQVSSNKKYTGKNTDDTPNDLLQPLNLVYTEFEDSLLDEDQGTYWSGYYTFLQRKKGVELIAPAQSPKQSTPQPTESDYNNGYFNRYFLYNFSNYSTIETNQSTYRSFVDQDPSTQFEKYTPIQIIWTLTGKEEEVYKANFNNVRLTEKKQKVYGFNNFFTKKYTQYFQFGSNENLYSDGSELRYTKSKKPYIGYYHIHPEKGPMEGAQHKNEPHEFLEFIPSGSRLNPLPPSPQSGSYVEPSRNVSITGGGY